MSRRLAAILAADVAGYSRLRGADKERTHERLKAHRRQLVDPKIKEHHGRIVKTTGARNTVFTYKGKLRDGRPTPRRFS